MKILISKCLLGVPCRYNGKKLKQILTEKFINYTDYKLIPVCPEQLSGLTTPRDPSEIINGDGNDVLTGKCRIITVNGTDVTDQFIKGAKASLNIAQKNKTKKFIGYSGSPSCSCKMVYNGEFKGVMKNGLGITAALLKKNGIEIIDSNDFLEKLNNK